MVILIVQHNYFYLNHFLLYDSITVADFSVILPIILIALDCSAHRIGSTVRGPAGWCIAHGSRECVLAFSSSVNQLPQGLSGNRDGRYFSRFYTEDHKLSGRDANAGLSLLELLTGGNCGWGVAVRIFPVDFSAPLRPRATL